MNAGPPPRHTWPREQIEQLESLVARGGYTPAAMARALGRSLSSVEWQLSYLRLSAAGDGKGAEHLQEDKPIQRAIRIMQDRGIYQYSHTEGHMLLRRREYRPVTVQELCDRAGVERP